MNETYEDERFDKEHSRINKELTKVVIKIKCNNPDVLRIMCLTETLAAALVHRTMNEIKDDLNKMNREDEIKILNKLLDKNTELHHLELDELLGNLIEDYLKARKMH